MNNNFIHDILTRGEEGKKWLDKLPQLIKYFESKWLIKANDPFELSYNYVAPATRINGERVVLKIIFPPNGNFEPEVEALLIYNGSGCVKLFEADNENLGMLLERAYPGVNLSSSGNDEQETKVIAAVIKKLWQSAPETHHLKEVSGLIENILKYKEHFPNSKNLISPYLVDKAEDMIRMLISTTTKKAVLHGDLHQGNILSAQREPWLAIDPKGMWGDPVYETGAMIRNPYPTLARQPNVKQVLEKRINILSEELEVDPNRVLQWGFVQTVLSAIYRIEDHGDDAWRHAAEIAQILDKIRL